MKTKIRDSAEQVRRVLSTRRSLTLVGLAMELGGTSMNDIGMAVGWMARGHEVSLERRDGALWVVLSPQPTPTLAAQGNSGRGVV